MKNFEILYYFMNEDVTLIEVKDLDKTEKSEALHWLYIKNSDLTYQRLTFKDARVEDVSGNKINVREFENAEFRFDDNFGKLQVESSGHIIMKFPNENTPEPILSIVKNYP